jgi:RNA polymerase sigma-70 factor (ECF subfamily)
MSSNTLTASAAFEQRLAEARRDSVEALDLVLETCRPHLLLLGRRMLRPDMRGKVDASDLVQETFLKARQEFRQFLGQTRGELLGWLRQVFLRSLANLRRHYLDTKKRQLLREVSPTEVDPACLGNGLLAPTPPPPMLAAAHERDAELQRALTCLPQHYREVIRLRLEQEYTF